MKTCATYRLEKRSRIGKDKRPEYYYFWKMKVPGGWKILDNKEFSTTKEAEKWLINHCHKTTDFPDDLSWDVAVSVKSWRYCFDRKESHG